MVTVAPPVGAAAERVIVHVMELPAVTVDGVQLNKEIVGRLELPLPLLPLPLPLLPLPLPLPLLLPLPEIVPPVALTAKAPPAGSTPTAARVTGVLLAAEVMVKVIDATTPLAIGVVSIPLAIHV
jgi:hypothetical protein